MRHRILFKHALLTLLTGLIAALLPVTIVDAAHQTLETNPVTVALTEDLIEVDAGFTGASVILFGVANPVDTATVDIIATVSGPPQDLSVRPMMRAGPIWTPGEASIAEDIPGLFFILSSKDIDAIANQASQDKYGLDIETLPITLKQTNQSRAAQPAPAMRAAILNTASKRGLFRTFTGQVTLLNNGLFSIRINLPAATPVGNYTITVTAWQEGTLIGSDQATLAVDKTGIERTIYNLAHEYAFFYGVVCVLISLFAGWAVSMLFRKS